MKKNNKTSGTKNETDKKVHSANDWEHANLGDNSRNDKFLRLMGATKKNHSGKIVIGDKTSAHPRSVEETEKLTETLEEQYKQGMELKLSGCAKRHVGLGFNGAEKAEVVPAKIHKVWKEDEEGGDGKEGGGDEDVRGGGDGSDDVGESVKKKDKKDGEKRNKDGAKKKKKEKVVDIEDKKDGKIEIEDKKIEKEKDESKEKRKGEKKREKHKEDKEIISKEKKFGYFVKSSE